MSGSRSGGSRSEAVSLRFLFDVHVHYGAHVELRRHGVDVLHAGQPGLGLADADDATLLRFAREENRILLTRNYQDFAPLVHGMAREGHRFPGVLFLSPAIRQNDAGAHVRALLAWIEETPSGTNPVANGSGWLAL